MLVLVCLSAVLTAGCPVTMLLSVVGLSVLLLGVKVALLMWAVVCLVSDLLPVRWIVVLLLARDMNH